MRNDLHLDPDGLRAAAADVGRVLGVLEPISPGAGFADLLSGLRDGPALILDLERSLVTLDRIRAELTSLEVAARRAADRAEAADLEIARMLRQAGSER